MKNLIKKIWKWMRSDGLLHIACSALIVLTFAAVLPLWAAALIAAVAGVAKEIYDRHNGGVAEWHDIICDAIGIVYGVLIFLVWLWLK